MKLFKAPYIYPITSPVLHNGAVLCSDEGEILDLLDFHHCQALTLTADHLEVVELDHILTCGFVNTHCHLELSYLKNQIPTHTGLAEFIRHIQAIRKNFSQEDILKAIQEADEELYNNGVIAVGDISNDEFTLAVKQKSRVHYHTFVEVFAFSYDKAEDVFKQGQSVYEAYTSAGLSASIVPHAPYSVSESLFRYINEHAKNHQQFISIHSEEEPSENELFLTKTGALANQLRAFGLQLDQWNHPKTTSLEYTLSSLDASIKTLLVHNIYTTTPVFRDNLYYSFCANANVYIENKLPNYAYFKPLLSQLTLGTDSLASNWQLSIYNEIQRIQSASSVFSFEDLLQMATLNGAKFLGIQAWAGGLDRGKTPGLVHISKDHQIQRLC